MSVCKVRVLCSYVIKAMSQKSNEMKNLEVQNKRNLNCSCVIESLIRGGIKAPFMTKGMWTLHLCFTL